MSTLSTNTIIPVTGTTVTIGESGDTITCGGTASGFGGGKLLQVAQTVKTDVYTSSSTSWADIISLSITPATSGNKLLISAHIGAAGNTTTSSGYQFRLTVDGTAVCIGDADGSNRARVSIQDHAGSVSDFASASSCQFLYTTTGTSAHTIKLQGQVGGGTLVFNRTVGDNSDSQYYGRSASTLTAMEVAQ